MAKRKPAKAGLRESVKRGAVKAIKEAPVVDEEDDVDLDVYGGDAVDDEDEEGADHEEISLDDDEAVDLDDLHTDALSDDEDAIDGMSVSDDEEDIEGGDDPASIVSQMQDLLGSLAAELGVEDEGDEDAPLEDDELDFEDGGEEGELDGELDALDDEGGEGEEGFDDEGGDELSSEDEDDEDEDLGGPKLREETDTSTKPKKLPGTPVPKNGPREDQLHKSGTEVKGKASLPPGKGATGLENRSDNDKAEDVTFKASKGSKKAKALPKGKPASVGNQGKGPEKTKPTDPFKALSGKNEAIDRVMQKALEGLEIDIAEESARFAELGGFLTETARAQGRRLFENAVSKRLRRIAEAVDRHYRSVFKAEVNGMQEGLVEKIDEFMDFMIAEFLEENKLHVDHGLTVEISESFLSGMKELFEAHNVVVPKSKVDKVAKLEEELAAKEIREKELYERAMKMRKENIQLRREKAVNKVSEGLSALQASKLAQLAENVEYRSMKQFVEDLKIVRQTHFNVRPTVKSKEAPSFEALAEDVNPKPVAKDRITGYADVLARTARK